MPRFQQAFDEVQGSDLQKVKTPESSQSVTDRLYEIEGLSGII
ncbi:hypothetical protein EV132_1216 [Rhizobium sullae]|uniref:Uncharacterized protein n=1 Tax=Rhizobium sullae TaxID=50338 RepID=A0A4R3PT81_RHISU|nr:hypothetical protein EV132_1216 [Rhizobium sullae]